MTSIHPYIAIAMSSSKLEADRPPKRMRLGTKSCAECRRRKVRCIYTQGISICKECVLHDAACVPQTARQAGQLTPESMDDDKSMRRRLEELEGMVRTLCKAVDFNAGPSNPSRLDISAEALRQLRRPSTPDPRSDSSLIGRSTMDLSEVETPNGLPLKSFEDAPLLSLFKAAMLIEGSEGQGDTNRTGLTVQLRIQACIKSLNALIPSFEDLTLILQITERYWPLWHAFPLDILPTSNDPQNDGVAKVRSFILDSMTSSNSLTVAKAILSLALCVQQLPAHFKSQRLKLPASPSALVDSYLVGAETLLPVNESSSSTIDGLECFILQSKLYINMGKPRNAWLCLRRALSYAVLQGLHTVDDSGDERRLGVWAHIWQFDRNLSLILGLPYAVPDTHPGVANPHICQPAQVQMMHDFGIIAGHVIDRNQSHQKFDYSVTKRIEQELLEYENGAGSSMLNTVSDPSMPLQVIYDLQVGKLFYHNLCKLTHLPYMLKSHLDPQYEHHRLAALSAAREMITAWQQLRECSGDALIICDLMDFEVFTAAIVLVLNLLSPSCTDPIHQQASDWERVHETTSNLQHVSGEMDCNVASQAATLLEYLSAAHQGIYDGPEIYEAVIPYFGSVRISRTRKVAPDMMKGGWDEQELFGNTVEFNADSFVPFTQNYMGDCLTEAELGVDWTAVLNADIGYEWSQSFHSSGFGMT
jgi:hypothetical protein